MYYCYVSSPIGDLLVAGDADGLEFLGFPSGKMRRDPEPDWIFNEQPFVETRRQLDEYFQGERKVFDLPLRLSGTEFQVQVLEELLRRLLEAALGQTESESRSVFTHFL